MQTILVIIKSECFRLTIQDSLQEHFDVISCGDVITGAEILRHNPDALVLDLFLPGIDGISFLKNSRCSLPHVTIILTSYISPDILQSMSDLGIDHVIRKPCHISAITRQLIDSLK